MANNNDETSLNEDEEMMVDREFENNDQKPEKMFTLKKWNAVAMWSWDVECDTCAICRVQVMESYSIEGECKTESELSGDEDDNRW
ncbi:hypothetical protein AVEN_56596-1 [Araneus ventricosus]|uniref:Uncharacterized protein n=1 Tax=Araneus ventricosus TaxID=182803 RepID=A0A4Y2RCQ7_ARAVE|nr:hypothetical protein AVEN_87716-1 [Araneus ventricosus]GBN79755.1 hypothetical protein AVEN_200404-1 [Araneus ventricosus]GBN79768.1 hypothetical protein AVEN_56596-1 [Araneus ventricosus]